MSCEKKLIFEPVRYRAQGQAYTGKSAKSKHDCREIPQYGIHTSRKLGFTPNCQRKCLSPANSKIPVVLLLQPCKRVSYT